MYLGSGVGTARWRDLDICGWFPAASCMRTWGWGENCCSALPPGLLNDKLSPLSPPGLEGLLCLRQREGASSLFSFLSRLSDSESSQPALAPTLHLCGSQFTLAEAAEPLSLLPPTSLTQLHLLEADSLAQEPTSLSPTVFLLCVGDSDALPSGPPVCILSLQ